MEPIPQVSAPRSIPIGPSVEQWRAMSPEAREEFLIEVNDALSDPLILMSEGRPHKLTKARAIDLLGLYFRTLGRVVYLAEELSVVYPGEQVFSPDVLAVVGVEQPEDDQRLSWVVAEEQRGIDFVLEVLHLGNRKKDLVDNVERYARLRIPEYFVYDRARQQILGYRLGRGTRYDRIVPQAGRYGSTILGVDLAIQGGNLRFFQGSAELYSSEDLIGRLMQMMENLEAQAQQEAERANLETERANLETERANEAIAGLRAALLGALDVRGLPLPDDLRARVMACNDPTQLQRWLLRALTASCARDAVEG